MGDDFPVKSRIELLPHQTLEETEKKRGENNDNVRAVLGEQGQINESLKNRILLQKLTQKQQILNM